MSNVEHDKAPAGMLRFEGTPLEIGGQIWERMCNPAIRTVSNQGDQLQLARLYAGILLAGFGSMAADFGHEQASDLLIQITTEFANIVGELQQDQAAGPPPTPPAQQGEKT